MSFQVLDPCSSAWGYYGKAAPSRGASLGSTRAVCRTARRLYLAGTSWTHSRPRGTTTLTFRHNASSDTPGSYPSRSLPKSCCDRTGSEPSLCQSWIFPLVYQLWQWPEGYTFRPNRNISWKSVKAEARWLWKEGLFRGCRTPYCALSPLVRSRCAQVFLDQWIVVQLHA